MYRFMLQRCQEKNVLRVEKSSTIFSASLRAKIKNSKPPIANHVCLKIAEARTTCANAAIELMIAHFFQHSILFNASPARLVSL